MDKQEWKLKREHGPKRMSIAASDKHACPDGD
jgi:hypothetical protein